MLLHTYPGPQTLGTSSLRTYSRIYKFRGTQIVTPFIKTGYSLYETGPSALGSCDPLSSPVDSADWTADHQLPVEGTADKAQCRWKKLAHSYTKVWSLLGSMKFTLCWLCTWLNWKGRNPACKSPGVQTHTRSILSLSNFSLLQVILSQVKPSFAG